MKARMYTQHMFCVREVHGEYLRKDARYTVERRYGANLRQSVHFRNDDTGSGTFMSEYNLRQAIARGDLVMVD